MTIVKQMLCCVDEAVNFLIKNITIVVNTVPHPDPQVAIDLMAEIVLKQFIMPGTNFV